MPWTAGKVLDLLLVRRVHGGFPEPVRKWLRCRIICAAVVRLYKHVYPAEIPFDKIQELRNHSSAHMTSFCKEDTTTFIQAAAMATARCHLWLTQVTSCKCLAWGPGRLACTFHALTVPCCWQVQYNLQKERIAWHPCAPTIRAMLTELAAWGAPQAT
jgi:hypothetical protein